ncbi:aldehyde dehydrogenase family protein [Cryobacterium sp. Y50]|uniref:aldehyde dehydrogenase family protein n=1 Tax=Cryobacterium sp. Y50 TaxID=2048286 RepID=UPI000CE4FC61|nr:aldehyde dehydrogenase family protein [Cryobacterium sp. Y50]
MDIIPDPVKQYVDGRRFRMLIDGALVESQSGQRVITVNPNTGEDLAEVPEGGAEDVQRAVSAARAAQPAWDALGVAGRSKAFKRFAQLVAEHREDLAMLDAIDCGNPVQQMRLDVDLALNYVAGWPPLAAAMNGQVIPASPGNLHYTASKPYGVVGRITAYNHPAMFAITRPLPSLITGNTLVMKPAPQASLSALLLAELYNEAFPPGVVNIVTGGAEVGDSLVTDPRVKRLAFTGSVGTGLTIQRRAAESGHVKYVTLELGGKNAMVIMPDADVDEAVEGAIFGMNFNVSQGQSCGSNSRVLVHSTLYDEFTSKLAARVSEYHVGAAYDETNDMGPLVSRQHYERVQSYIDSGLQEGAELLTGGERPDGAPDGGFYLRPTMFGSVRKDMRIASEEIFGPVIAVMRFDGYEEMLDLANGTDLGLTASVWTRDLSLAHRTADRLDAGYVWINDSSRHYFGTPFGGTRNSGIGREESADELLSFLESKVVHTRLSDPGVAFERLIAKR